MTISTNNPTLASLSPETANFRFTHKQKKAAEKCIRLHLPFVLFSEAQEEGYNFIADTPYNVNNENFEFGTFTSDKLEAGEAGSFKFKFHIGFFDQQEYPAVIRDNLTADEVLAMDESKDSCHRESVIPATSSTNQVVYNSQVFAIKSRLKSGSRGGKVVLSRVIVRKSKKSPIDVAEEYFMKTPAVFRAVFYHPETGIWIVATPEILIKYDKATHDFESMALAGTRPTSVFEEGWSVKNQREHKYVVRHIVDTFKYYRINTQYPKEPETLTLGTIQHLYTPIIGNYKFTRFELEDLISRLSPTPAVAGYPRDFSVDCIEAVELHNRYCYGGWMGLEKPRESNFYVNLRSALAVPLRDSHGNITEYLYNIFAGGGILTQSNAKSEWEETRLKSQNLCDTIGGEDQIEP